ncbi:hypothetical protein FJ420_32870 [Mesorhizobium sp. B3-1-3]|uniref:hypothetical protein n=1 Tax=unclassified Mesorhizobium TaxID=325217 RepID=UPI00112C74DA|nr:MULTISPECIES: hypothetical protein [unclassified Mesorhizobium]TPI57268.1 hypothetical protein FJ417_22490 [Mesorhizobium sp. B3-1-7]TPI58766.1 hypothetical protein FJ420_32870 [Mesorhizobium sp. B3-1-3]TPI71564.1 hypothetical protein FJ424_01690 [Mesorhizobium sp. B3-1-8]TPJ33448.1 hypothetical protein FJ418_15525 [Mesorhizobium sp. B2-8-3]
MQHEREIDALLSSGETGSIIDRLMALPRPTNDVKTEWDRAVSNRFEIRLARQMRSQMDSASEQQGHLSERQTAA